MSLHNVVQNVWESLGHSFFSSCRGRILHHNCVKACTSLHNLVLQLVSTLR
ncbi:hypothetical protein GBAR_LOCUS5911 [Geodia barretti]|uniref:Uncharacterized protein n=1 Tax=Geodia barretti TaxID=519541 RepID=A0AA35RE24_GEOBA|nr:hypothetical protein GBAR_LOCUS5911 [Geodia barretti]